MICSLNHHDRAGQQPLARRTLLVSWPTFAANRLQPIRVSIRCIFKPSFLLLLHIAVDWRPSRPAYQRGKTRRKTTTTTTTTTGRSSPATEWRFADSCTVHRAGWRRTGTGFSCGGTTWAWRTPWGAFWPGTSPRSRLPPRRHWPPGLWSRTGNLDVPGPCVMVTLTCAATRATLKRAESRPSTSRDLGPVLPVVKTRSPVPRVQRREATGRPYPPRGQAAERGRGEGSRLRRYRHRRNACAAVSANTTGSRRRCSGRTGWRTEPATSRVPTCRSTRARCAEPRGPARTPSASAPRWTTRTAPCTPRPHVNILPR